MSEPLPEEVTVAGLKVLLFKREETPLLEEEPEYAEFLAAFGPAISNYVSGRLREMYLGRWLARKAIRQILGVDPGWIRASADRRPELPQGIAASLTHTKIDGVRVAVVAATRSTDRVLGIDLEPRFSELQAEKLSDRFNGYFERGKTKLDAHSMTELFTIYEACVKALSQKNRGIVSPSHLKLESKTEDSWVVTHPESGTRIEGILLNYSGAKLALGVA